MLDEIARLVRLDRATLGGPVGRVEAVVARMNDQDVAALNAGASLPLPALELVWPVDLVIADAHLLEVDDARRTDQKVHWQLTDAAGVGNEMVGRVQVRADVQRRGDLHAAHTFERDPLDPFDRRPVVASEPGRIDVPVL